MNDDRTVGAKGRTETAPALLPFPADDGELPPGTRVGEYAIECTIASGGCGTVYSAMHRMLGRRVAVKLLHRSLATSAEMVERFVREARVVNQIRNPYIVDVYDLSTLPDGRPYMVMELLRGTSLRALLDRRGRFGVQEALSILTPVCKALHAAHEAGVVHRDLKASNVMVLKEGDAPEVRLLDFGIAKLLRTDGAPGITGIGQRLGTPYAMSPEQIRGGPIDGRADVYALGVLLFQLLTGQVPFHSEVGPELERLHLESPPPAPSLRAPVSPAIDKLVLQTLAKDPALRPQSARKFLEALQEIVQPGALAQVKTSGRGLGVYLEVHLRSGADDDDALAALGTLLDTAEVELQRAGMSLYLATGSALLGVAALETNEVRAESQRASARAAIVRIEAAAAQSSGVVSLRGRLHEDQAQLEETESGLQVKGGAVVQVGSWPQP